MGLLPLLLLLSFLSLSSAEIARSIGINYGQLGNNLPTPSHSISLVQSLNAHRVKIYDANPSILTALSKTQLQVSIMVPNQAISNISTNQSAADEWVCNNLLPFYPKTLIRYLLVGNEILSDTSNKQVWYDLLPAMRKIKWSLKSYNISNVKVGTPLAMDALQTTFPPSNGTFRPDISDTVMKPMLQFLYRTKSFYFVDVYTYFAWAASPKTISLDYALLKPTNITYADPVSGLTYTNLLDQLLDAVYAAMTRVGFPGVRIAIAETGWPNAGDFDEIGANIYNAAIYNRNLARKMAVKPALGTPARPGRVIPTFIFSLFNENQKTGPGTERHWGLFYPNGTGIYEVDLTGKLPDSAYKSLPAPTNNEPYKGKIWCVVVEGKVNATDLGGALTYACGQGNGTCNAIQPGKACYHPNTLVSHASYAFNLYWQQFRSVGGTCYFNGLAVQTINDPSYGSCKYPSLTN
ncbi:probable glucan endo-1,3-beta-glucosidase A6 [Magnolia sinica]|uniref:probable glucan endo-1,3-beta-glucosidase A6 n=1 Tax=Magnolia sinica TaxID=86752 RepID=UPI00265ADA4E|nr:probable glucan endo-1,3-beta-glucosidase A6 [Magnolia sinica]